MLLKEWQAWIDNGSDMWEDPHPKSHTMDTKGHYTDKNDILT